jgi:hypothetical protein
LLSSFCPRGNPSPPEAGTLLIWLPALASVGSTDEDLMCPGHQFTPTPGLDHGTQLQILVPQLAGSPHAAGHCKVSLGIVASCPAAFELLTDGMFFGAKTNTRRACRHHPTFQSDQSWNASVQLHIYMRTREWETEN